MSSRAADAAPTPPAIADATALNEIIVTAQRRNERLQDVPIAITAIGADQLAARNISDISTLRGEVPSLTISGYGGVAGGALFSIRGVSGEPLPIGAGQATAVYLDGVYLPRTDAGLFTLDDVQRIEVLRGPQGTLYGRNATAGAINIITRDPGDTLAGGLDVNYGNYNAVNVRGFVSGPLAQGLSGDISSAFSRHDGYYINTFTDSRVDGQDSDTVRGKLRYVSPEESFDATVAADTSESRGPQFNKSLVSPTGAYVGIGNPNDISSDLGNRAISRSMSRGASLIADYQVDSAMKVTSVSGYRKFDDLAIYDGDGTADLYHLVTAGHEAAETFSEEVRSVLTLDRFRATTGANYFHERETFGLGIGTPVVPINFTSPYDTSTLNAAAAFAQGEFDATDKLTLVAGLRYNHEKRDFTIDYAQSLPVHGGYLVGDLSANAVLPSVGINFKAAPDVLLYAKVSEGYQAPGFNFAPGLGQPVNTFDAEKLWAYELGAKTQFLDRRVTLNLTGFYYDYKNIQVRTVVGPGVTRIVNGASAGVKGGEIELEGRPVGGLTLSAHASYVDALYTSFCDGITAANPVGNDPFCAGSTAFADRSGNRLNGAPLWSGGVNANYTTQLTNSLGLNANVGYLFETTAYYSTANEVPVSTGGWDRLDARIGLQIKGGPEVYVFGNNLNDNRYAAGPLRLSPFIVNATLNDPRLYGIGIRYQF